MYGPCRTRRERSSALPSGAVSVGACCPAVRERAAVQPVEHVTQNTRAASIDADGGHDGRRIMSATAYHGEQLQKPPSISPLRPGLDLLEGFPAAYDWPRGRRCRGGPLPSANPRARPLGFATAGQPTG